MLHELPITNVRLLACHEDWQQMTPAARGRHCQSCDRVVIDFTQAAMTELARARAAAPDGRVCGRFRLSQLAPESRPAPPQLRPRLRRFLLAAVLVLVLGLSARQAWAQAQRPVAPFQPAATAPLYQLPGSMPMPTVAPPDTAQPAPAENQEQVWVGLLVEKMPEPRGGMEGLMKFFQKEARYPAEALHDQVEGKVFVSFVVKSTGQIAEAQVVRGLHPQLDAEALRVVRLMPPWTPGAQNGKPVDVQYTMPINFTYRAGKAAGKRARPTR
ncbi:energy transducer TonB [Hymenobacter gummosus]|uniref:Energy transducer TonB n=1 Tax=Hymenobacter gummosus TaxID=1776032 RepID=A0A431TXZ8_9BACT|nr:energy transducer TonB [Hymenobacter gummosus]RTQ47152.1 energy transducer TonB [Hymenobacter gummosus]